MAMLQTMLLSILLIFQSIFMNVFFVPATTDAIDYGGDPYVEPVITQYLRIYENGVTDYAIVVPDDAAKSILTGARWLQEFLAEMTGTTPALYTVSQDNLRIADGFTHYIALGNTGLDAGALAADAVQLKDEGFVKRVVDDNVYIYGIGRGTMYGCSSFIEEQLGCRWFAQELKVIPSKQTVAIDRNLRNIQNTTLEYRDVYWNVVNSSAEFKAFHKINTGMGAYLGEEYGYGVNYADFCHTMERLVPADQYYAEHPEYFSWNQEKNAWTTEQRCLTNPEVLRITIENTINAIRNSPEAVIMSVTQNDNGGVCECTDCLAMDAKYGNPSGTNIWFVNQVAQAVEEAFPGRNIAIDTFAYGYTTHAPTGIAPRENVIVRLCSIDSCFCHPIDACGHGRDEGFFEKRKEKSSVFAQDIQNWSALCDVNGAKLYIWDYTTHFKTYSMPFPNLHVLSNNIQFFVENNVYGIFEQGNYDGGRNGEFDSLRAYLLMKLLWNPSMNVDHTMTEFMNVYYGENAAPFVREYLDSITRIALDTSHLFIFGRPENNVYFNSANLKKFDALWDKAEQAAAGNQYQLDNVRRSRLSLRHYKANMVTGEFSILNPNRVAENKKLFHDSIMLGMNKFKESEPICEPYSEYVWAMRPIEWGDPIAWVFLVDESKVKPLDVDAYRAAHA